MKNLLIKKGHKFIVKKLKSVQKHTALLRVMKISHKATKVVKVKVKRAKKIIKKNFKQSSKNI